MLHKMACSNPTYHKARPGKKKDWLNGIFQGTKPIWFLGDLNLTSIPAFHNPDYQIDSNQEATFYHLLQILNRPQARPLIKVVVLIPITPL